MLVIVVMVVVVVVVCVCVCVRERERERELWQSVYLQHSCSDNDLPLSQRT